LILYTEVFSVLNIRPLGGAQSVKLYGREMEKEG